MYSLFFLVFLWYSVAGSIEDSPLELESPGSFSPLPPPSPLHLPPTRSHFLFTFLPFVCCLLSRTSICRRLNALLPSNSCALSRARAHALFLSCSLLCSRSCSPSLPLSLLVSPSLVVSLSPFVFHTTCVLVFCLAVSVSVFVSLSAPGSSTSVSVSVSVSISLCPCLCLCTCIYKITHALMQQAGVEEVEHVLAAVRLRFS